MAETIVKIPFSFTVAGKNCPSGRYLVRQETTGNFVTLINKDSLQSFSWVVGPGASDPVGGKVVLTFDESGQAHALRSIQLGSLITSRLDNRSEETRHVSPRLSQGRYVKSGSLRSIRYQDDEAQIEGRAIAMYWPSLLY
jgi:hypothetical protein